MKAGNIKPVILFPQFKGTVVAVGNHFPSIIIMRNTRDVSARNTTAYPGNTKSLQIFRSLQRRHIQAFFVPANIGSAIIKGMHVKINDAMGFRVFGEEIHESCPFKNSDSIIISQRGTYCKSKIQRMNRDFLTFYRIWRDSSFAGESSHDVHNYLI
jgi:hypothetical protein